VTAFVMKERTWNDVSITGSQMLRGREAPGISENGKGIPVVLGCGKKARSSSGSFVTDLVPEAVEIVVPCPAIGSQSELGSIREDTVGTA